MSFFKPMTEMSSNKTVARLHALIWALIYGGLLLLILGIFVQRSSDEGDALGLTMMVAGGLMAVAGCALVVVRSKMKDAP